MTVHRVVDAKQIGAELARANTVIGRAQKLAVLEACALGVEIVAKDAPVDTGRLKQSARLRKRGKSGHPEIVFDAPYAGPVEQGSRPHWVPMTALVRWVRRHAGAFGLAKRAPSAPKKLSDDPKKRRRQTKALARRVAWDDNVVSIARAIRLKIARVGTKPRWYVKKNIPRLSAILMTMLREAKAKVLAHLARRG